MDRCSAAAPMVVTFVSVQTMAGAEEARRILLDALAGARHVQVDCSGVTDVDLGFVQVLLAARRSARARGITLALARPAAGPLRDALERAGLLCGITTEGASTDESFWGEATP